MIIKKSFDLIKKLYQEDSAMSMSKYVKPAKVIREIKLEWNERLKKQQPEGYSAQELINTKNESTKYDCLDYLKSQTIPGPFTTAFQVHEYMSCCPESKAKNKRMKMDVKYARLMCTSMNPSKAAVFRLQRNHKDLTTDEYADNLMAYIDTARSCKNITMTDLNNILFGIASNVSPLDFSISGRSEEETNFMVGDHIAAFWLTEEYQLIQLSMMLKSKYRISYEWRAQMITVGNSQKKQSS